MSMAIIVFVKYKSPKIVTERSEDILGRDLHMGHNRSEGSRGKDVASDDQQDQPAVEAPSAFMRNLFGVLHLALPPLHLVQSFC